MSGRFQTPPIILGIPTKVTFARGVSHDDASPYNQRRMDGTNGGPKLVLTSYGQPSHTGVRMA